jgi:hypothetical protein
VAKPKIEADHALDSETYPDGLPRFYGLCKNPNCTFETKKTFPNKRQAVSAGKKEHKTCNA